MQCLYCGETSWRPFRWIANGEYCSREHRKLYHERLRKVVSELANCQSATAKATIPGVSVVAELPSAQIEPNAGVCGDLLPFSASGIPGAASDYEQMAVANGDCPEALLQDAVHPVSLQSQSLLPIWTNDDQAGVDAWQPLPVVSAGGRSTPVGSTAGMLPAGFENHAQIKRWGLKIKFPKA